MDNAYSDALTALLRDHCTPAHVRAVEAGQGAAPLWSVLRDSGFADCLLPEDAGGAGLSLAEVAPLLFAMGWHAMPLPLAQTMFARAVLHQAGIDIPEGPIALATFDAAVPEAEPLEKRRKARAAIGGSPPAPWESCAAARLPPP